MKKQLGEAGGKTHPEVLPSASFSLQGGDCLPENHRQHPGAPLAGWEHISHLLCGGQVPEAGTVEEGTDTLGKE